MRRAYVINVCISKQKTNDDDDAFWWLARFNKFLPITGCGKYYFGQNFQSGEIFRLIKNSLIIYDNRHKIQIFPHYCTLCPNFQTYNIYDGYRSLYRRISYEKQFYIYYV